MTIYYRARPEPPTRRMHPYGFRDGLCEAQNWRCCYCGGHMRQIEAGAQHPADATVDHILPHLYGGQADFDNSVAACRACNRTRGCMKAYAFFKFRRTLVKRRLWAPATEPDRRALFEMSEFAEQRRRTRLVACRTGRSRAEVGVEIAREMGVGA